MNAVDVIRRLHQHRVWTRARLLEAARSLSLEKLRREFPIGPGSMFATLVHLYGAEFVWLEALLGSPKPRFPQLVDFTALDDLQRDWSGLDARWQEYLGRLSEAELSRPVTRTNAAGKTFTTSAADVMLHVCTHGFYHAAQIVNMLRQLGAAALPETNFITMARERSISTPGPAGG